MSFKTLKTTFYLKASKERKTSMLRKLLNQITNKEDLKRKISQRKKRKRRKMKIKEEDS